MQEPGSPAHAGGAAASVTITMDTVRRVADVTLPDLEDEVGRARHAFRDLVAAVEPDGLFGEDPVGRALAATHRAAHDVFVQTVAGIGQDLRDLQERLRATLRTYDTADADVEALLLAVSRPMSTRSHADRRQEGAVHQHRDQLSGRPGPGRPDARSEPAGAPAIDPSQDGPCDRQQP